MSKEIDFWNEQWKLDPRSTHECPNCGALWPKEANFCGFCGILLPGEEEKNKIKGINEKLD